MTLSTSLLLALSLSTDAFAAATGKGAGLRHPPVTEVFRIGAVFAFFETLTPLLGWAAGVFFARFITAVDHWIAFGLLGIVGGRMILHSLRHDKPGRHGLVLTLGVLVTTALATSMDGAAVGISLALVDVNIAVLVALIGTVTFTMACCGASIGLKAGPLFGRWAEFLGGLGLIGIGTKILLDHTLL